MKDYYNCVCLGDSYELSTFATWQKCITVSLVKISLLYVQVRKDNSYILGFLRP